MALLLTFCPKLETSSKLITLDQSGDDFFCLKYLKAFRNASSSLSSSFFSILLSKSYQNNCRRRKFLICVVVVIHKMWKAERSVDHLLDYYQSHRILWLCYYYSDIQCTSLNSVSACSCLVCWTAYILSIPLPYTIYRWPFSLGTASCTSFSWKYSVMSDDEE